MMRSGFTNRRKLYQWQRNVSLVLLLFCFYDMAVADVLFPGSCEREGAMMPSFTTPAPDQQSLSTIGDVAPEPQEAPADSTPIEDDCFCCCAHIVPAENYNVPPLLFQPPSIESHPGNIPATPVAELFRPPRFA
ncbi:MAG: hypothetical protein JST84_00205 [Acidobacteria bacterium]|nr:hypothetical protein [Acidobacteriota bacterium]